ncbi:MAG: hypothetical protein JOZ38_02155, partial [Candidatus Eremiobacteraeota bacterium]|nr:hypothetical protein [Candidatus Eremiobacteraeota bacterium]
LGAWCAQGDPSRPTTILSSGFDLTLTNENGATSTGQPQGMSRNTIVALQWDLVNGTITSDGQRIDWTNGTFWSRCSANSPGNLDGLWFAAGDASRQCSIRQRYGTLIFRNEQGVVGRGSFDGPMHLTADWSGTLIGARISRNGKRLDWSNGTFWTRSPF